MLDKMALASDPDKPIYKKMTNSEKPLPNGYDVLQNLDSGFEDTFWAGDNRWTPTPQLPNTSAPDG